MTQYATLLRLVSAKPTRDPQAKDLNHGKLALPAGEMATKYADRMTPGNPGGPKAQTSVARPVARRVARIESARVVLKLKQWQKYDTCQEKRARDAQQELAVQVSCQRNQTIRGTKTQP